MKWCMWVTGKNKAKRPLMRGGCTFLYHWARDGSYTHVAHTEHENKVLDDARTHCMQLIYIGAYIALTCTYMWNHSCCTVYYAHRTYRTRNRTRLKAKSKHAPHFWDRNFCPQWPLRGQDVRVLRSLACEHCTVCATCVWTIALMNGGTKKEHLLALSVLEIFWLTPSMRVALWRFSEKTTDKAVWTKVQTRDLFLWRKLFNAVSQCLEA